MDLLVFVPFAAGIIVAITAIAKNAGLPPRVAPILELAAGEVFVITGVLTGAVTLDVGDLPVSASLFWAVLYGAITGLTAAGVYTDRRAVATAGDT